MMAAATSRSPPYSPLDPFCPFLLCLGVVILASDDAITFSGSSSLTLTSRLEMVLDLQSVRSGLGPDHAGKGEEEELGAHDQRARPD